MTYLVSVACASRHFAVLFYDIERQCVIVYDGLFYKLTTWQHHIIHTLKKYGLKRHNAKCNVVVKTKPPVIELCFDDKYAPWCVYNDPIIRQVDGYNCGPIACLKVMEIYGILPPDSIAEVAHQRYGYRGVVMDHYSRFLAQHDRDIKLILNKSGFERFSRDCSVRKNELSGGVDNDEAQIADKESDDEAQVSDKAADDKGKEEGKEADNNSHTSNKRKLAKEKKNTKQKEGAKKAMKQCGDAALKAGISPGAVVTLQVDYRTCYNPEGLVAIVYDVNPRTDGALPQSKITQIDEVVKCQLLLSATTHRQSSLAKSIDDAILQTSSILSSFLVGVATADAVIVNVLYRPSFPPVPRTLRAPGGSSPKSIDLTLRRHVKL
jgi:hypothetical protein